VDSRRRAQSPRRSNEHERSEVARARAVARRETADVGMDNSSQAARSSRGRARLNPAPVRGFVGAVRGSEIKSRSGQRQMRRAASSMAPPALHIKLPTGQRGRSTWLNLEAADRFFPASPGMSQLAPTADAPRNFGLDRPPKTRAPNSRLSQITIVPRAATACAAEKFPNLAICY
jgi:hypothetical protein